MATACMIPDTRGIVFAATRLEAAEHPSGIGIPFQIFIMQLASAGRVRALVACGFTHPRLPLALSPDNDSQSGLSPAGYRIRVSTLSYTSDARHIVMRSNG